MLGWFGFWVMCAIIAASENWFIIQKKKLQLKGAKFKWWE